LNVSQAFAMAATGNAELGLVALAQAVAYAGPSSYRVVPRELHGPIRQDAMLLNAGAGNAAAVEFLEYLRSDVALATIERHGYDRPR
jgi:molybdate transport system substrate-binding protein